MSHVRTQKSHKKTTATLAALAFIGAATFTGSSIAAAQAAPASSVEVVATVAIPFEKLTIESDTLPLGVKVVIQEGEPGEKRSYKAVSGEHAVIPGVPNKLEKLVKHPVDEITLVGIAESVTGVSDKTVAQKETEDAAAAEEARLASVRSERLYSLADLKFQGVINWGGYRFTYYSQQVLPGGGLNIPGRHVNEGGFVADGDGYIVIANDAPKGTVIETPFGYKGKVYDRGTLGNHMDVYTK